MPFIETHIPDLLVFEPVVHGDHRGYFFESYNANTFSAAGIHYKFVQDNQARSTYGVLRGLHYQLAPYAQTKLVRVLEGRIIDVAVDIRTGSPTYGQSFAIELSAENKKQLLVPQGFAHGYAVISETAEVMYKCDNFYHKASEGGIIFNDPALKIDWGIDLKDAIVSEKDLVLPKLADISHNFTYNR
ncbi:dTDP-4-dehydrorhamnose 3,5-epimerase [Chitinophaga sp. CB10]|uniref:dTDP-4-dehydrorhamnose 3,5-epimerase n=1 Tax=Chitinophaga sp. CB10 TaxID=1891659 RepID=UPI000AE82101|nr:dTDP-4-dehydrorhamnose 3,5-epimerase [Chitinophaga sp. CB10]